MDNLTDYFQQLGFSEYETKAYVALLQQHPLNGYALAKASGVPRANIYGVLQKLEERGAVVSINVDAGLLYEPISPGELIRRLESHLGDVLASAQRELESLATPVQQTYVQNILGGDCVLEHARSLINSAHTHLLIALWHPEAVLLAETLAQAQARNVTINMLCCQACTQECGGCQGNIYRYRITPDQEAHGLIVIQDNVEMLVGSMETQPAAIRTRQAGLIQMAAWYLRHSIMLAAVLTDVGSTLEDALRPETRHLLQLIGQGSSWLQFVRQWVEGELPTHLE